MHPLLVEDIQGEILLAFTEFRYLDIMSVKEVIMGERLKLFKLTGLAHEVLVGNTGEIEY